MHNETQRAHAVLQSSGHKRRVLRPWKDYLREMTMSLVNRRLALWGLFSVIALLSQTIPPSGTAVDHVASPSVQDFQQSLRFIPDRMAHYHVPGLSLACIHNGTVEWTRAFGVARIGGAPVTPE